MNHYPRHVGDFIRDTVGLSMAERGAYTALLDQYYAQEKPLPLNMGELYRICGAVTRPDQKAVDYVVSKYFEAKATGHHQKRCDEEIAIYRERSASASASAHARWSKGNANADTKTMRTHSDGNANQEPVTNNQKKEQKPARKRATPLPEDFEISERVKAWAAEKGFGLLDRHLEAFLGKVRAKGYTYIDWDEAFMNCIREDWGKVNAARPLPEKRASHSPAKFVEFGPRTEMPQHISAELAKFKAGGRP